MPQPAFDVALGDAAPRGTTPGASVPERTLPISVRAARDRLFDDADRHGPRAAALARRIVPAAVLVPLTLLLSASNLWRGMFVQSTSGSVADAVLLVPVLLALVLLAAACAPLARIPTLPLLGAGAIALGSGAALVHSGELVLATVPMACGGTLVGIGTARALRRAVWALPVLLAAGISDVHSVQGGLTNDLLSQVRSTPVASGRVEAIVRIPAHLVAQVDYVVLHIPVATGTWVLGVVDIVAVALLLALTHLFWQPLGRTAAALAAALVITIAAGTPMPVLPILGLAWALVNARLVWRSTRFSLRRLTYLGG